jgi:hypothetical protein
MNLTRERLREIRALGDDEFRTTFDLDNAVDDLLGEVDRLRAALRSCGALLDAIGDRIALGGTPDLKNLRQAAQTAHDISEGV